MKKSSCCGHQNSGKNQKKSIDYLFWTCLISVTIFYVLGQFFAQQIASIHWLNTMAHTAHQMIHAMWWGVLIGALFIGLLSKIPREFIVAILGPGGKVSGLCRATAAGVLLDLCSHGILMVASKLYERGASAGQVIAFLLASPWNSFSLTLVLIGLIGWQWTLTFIGLSLVIAIATGWIFDRLVDSGHLPTNPEQNLQVEAFDFFPEAKQRLRQTTFNREFFFSLIGTGIKDSKMVVRWLLLGILLAGFLRVFLNPEQFSQWFGPSIIGLMATIGLATVLEVCSEGSTPIAADILNRAQAPGNGFAFLMAGVATDYTEIMVIKDTTKSWKIALFIPLITVPQVVLVAWLINVLI